MAQYFIIWVPINLENAVPISEKHCVNRQDKQKYKKSCLAKEECNAADTEAALLHLTENFSSDIQYKKQGSNLTLDVDHLSWVSCIMILFSVS